jgi:regulatory subunit for Cdc7p protein kinase
VTTRQIPAEKPAQDVNDPHADGHDANEQPKTIDPSLLNRSDAIAKKKALRTRTRSNDVLHRAREMGKKIWSLDKLQKILETLDPDVFKQVQRGGAQAGSNNKLTEPTNLLQLLQNERMHGPSDRDPTVVTKELHYFKGPYIYVYDIEEKTKPVMVREYAKVADKKQGEWPQFRVASQGRCPFVEDHDFKEEREKSRSKERLVKAGVQATAPALRPPEVPPPKPTTGKRTLAEMEDGHNRGAGLRHESFDVSKVSNPPNIDFQAPQNAFMSRAMPGRFVAGEPVASGLQQSKATSAIRSQMISSTSGLLGVKAGTSKEIHGLQRKVLQKASTPVVSQDLSSRRLTAEMSHDSNTFIRSASVGGHSQRKMDVIEEAEEIKSRAKLRRTVSVTKTKVKTKARDPKPGYCENCQDKFDDFDDVSLCADPSHVCRT